MLKITQSSDLALKALRADNNEIVWGVGNGRTDYCYSRYIRQVL